MTANATDDIGVTKVAFFVNGVLVATDTDGTDGWSATWDSSAVAGGTYAVKAMATDTVGRRRAVVAVASRGDVQGDWRGQFGVDGKVLANWNGGTDCVSLPAGVTFTIEQGARYTWARPRPTSAPSRARAARSGAPRPGPTGPRSGCG